MAENDLSNPGSSQYSSDSLRVGDGTWDEGRDTFLLPNLMGLNFETMRYNGMGNRFAGLSQYHSVILGHGIVAAITFLFIVPAAIMTARFYHRNGRWAMRAHIWLQILTVGLTTVVFVLGYFAVGPARSLTNPHHGIGLAIFIAVLLQALGGWFVRAREKGKERLKLPVKMVLHQWSGRVIALLGIAQVALGLTLYGSPVYLFVLYALVVTALILTYFILDYRYNANNGLDDQESYVSGPTRYSRTEDSATTGRDDRRGERSLLPILGAAGLGAAIAKLTGRGKSRGEDESQSNWEAPRTRTDGASTRRGSGSRTGSRPPLTESSYLDEKYSEDEATKDNTWRNRFLGGAAGLGGFAALKRVFSRRRGKDDESVDSYRPRRGDGSSIGSSDYSRVEEGRTPQTPGRTPGPSQTPAGVGLSAGGAVQSPEREDRWRTVEERETAQAAAMRKNGSPVSHTRVSFATGPTPRPPVVHRKSGGSVDSYDDSRTSYSPEDTPQKPTRNPARLSNVRDGLATLGAVGLFREAWRKRKERKEERRVGEMRQRERQEERVHRRNGQRYTSDAFSPSRPDHARGRRRSSHTEMSESMLSGSDHELTAYGHRAPSQQQTSQRSPPNILTPGQPISSATPASYGQHPQPNTYIPDSHLPPPPPHQAQPLSPSQYQPIPFTSIQPPGPSASAAAIGLPPPGMLAAQHESHRGSASTQDDSGGTRSTPISVKVKMHNDGRHVTLRRLNEAEAAAAKEARHRELAEEVEGSGKRRRRRASSLSSSVAGGDDRWRRVERPSGPRASPSQTQNIPPTRQPAPTQTNIPLPPPGQSTTAFIPTVTAEQYPPQPGRTNFPPQTATPLSQNLPHTPRPSSSSFPQQSHPTTTHATHNTVTAAASAPTAQPSAFFSTSAISSPTAGQQQQAVHTGSHLYGTEGATTTTDVSAYDTNRRRRRAERAMVKVGNGTMGGAAGVEGGGGRVGSNGRVEFTR